MRVSHIEKLEFVCPNCDTTIIINSHSYRDVANDGLKCPACKDYIPNANNSISKIHQYNILVDELNELEHVDIY